MNWETVTLISILYQYGLLQILIKKIGAKTGSRTRKLVWQYACTIVLALFTAFLFGPPTFGLATVIIFFIGVTNAFGTYCHWRAYDLSMSRTAILSNLDDLVAIGLGYAFLGELTVLNPLMMAGIAVSIICAFAFTFVQSRGRERKHDWVHHALWVLGYTAVWGVAMFSMRFFSLQGIGLPTYVIAWYSGSLVGALITRYIIMGKDEAGPPLTKHQIGLVFVLALCIWSSLMLTFKVRELTPLTVTQPIQLVGEMALPTLIAMFVLGERKSMTRTEVMLILLSLIGVALIAVAY